MLVFDFIQTILLHSGILYVVFLAQGKGWLVSKVSNFLACLGSALFQFIFYVLPTNQLFKHVYINDKQHLWQSDVNEDKLLLTTRQGNLLSVAALHYSWKSFHVTGKPAEWKLH
jgi:hypothetical protein